MALSLIVLLLASRTRASGPEIYERMARRAFDVQSLFAQTCQSSPELGTARAEASSTCSLRHDPLVDTFQTNSDLALSAYFAGLAEERAVSHDCAIGFISAATATSAAFEQHVNDFETKLTLLAEETVLNVRIQERIRRASATAVAGGHRHRADPGPEVAHLRAELEQSGQRLLAIRHSIPLSEQADVASLISSEVTRLTLNETALVTLGSEAPIHLEGFDPFRFRRDLRRALNRANEALVRDRQLLRQPSHDRAMRESLAQDHDLVERYIAARPESDRSLRQVACRADATYGAGAELRDRALFLGSSALAAGTLGTGLVIRGTGLAAATPLRAAAARGSIPLRSSRILGVASVQVNLLSGANSLWRDCVEDASTVRSSHGSERCEEFTVTTMARNDCALAAALTALNGASSSARFRDFVARALPRSYLSRFPQLSGVQGEGNNLRIVNLQTGKVAGRLDVHTPTPREMNVVSMNIDSNYQRSGLGQALLRGALQRNPRVQTIRALGLDFDNERIVQEGLAKGLSLEQAIRQTPAYKIRAREGFSEFVPGSIASIGYGFSVQRPGAALGALAGGITLTISPEVERQLQSD